MPASSTCRCAGSLGDKRRKLGEGKDGEPDQIADIVKLYGRFADSDKSKIFVERRFRIYPRDGRAAVTTSLPDDH